MININLEKGNIKGATLICGFQSSWLVGPITIQYLIDHMKFDKIGDIWFESLIPISVVYKGRIIKPLSVFYNKENNIALLQCMVPIASIEWKLADAIEQLAGKIQAKEIICIEGVETEQEESDVFYISNCGNEKKIEEVGAAKMKNAVLFGVTSVFLIKDVCLMFCLLGKMRHIKTQNGPVLHSNSKSAANIIAFLNKYLDIKVDVKSLLEESEKIESEINKLSVQIKTKPEPKPSYFG